MANQLWPVAASTLKRAHFFRSAHQHIFSAFERLADAQQPLDFVTLKEELRRAGHLEEATPAYVASLTDGVPKSTNLEHYAAIIVEKARLRDLVAKAGRLLQDAYAAEHPSATLTDAALRELSATTETAGAKIVTAEESVRQYADAVSLGTMGAPVATGYRDVDALIGGFKPRDLVIVAARPSVGKSAFALGAAEAMARAGQVVLFFTLEMGVEGLSSRLVAGRARVESGAIERGSATPEQYSRWADALSAFEGLSLYFQPSVSTVTEVGAWARRIQQERGLGCVFLDYLQLLFPEGKHHSRENEVAVISRQLKRLAKDLNVPLVALSQLSRAAEGRADKRPHLSDLRDSGALEQDTDLCLLLHRPEMYGRTVDNDGIAEVIVAKNRGGATGCVRTAFIKEYAKFEDLHQGEQS